jgi:multiple sugar transport system substrate-binding protein
MIHEKSASEVDSPGKGFSRRFVIKSAAASTAAVALANFLASPALVGAQDVSLRLSTWDTSQEDLYQAMIDTFEEANPGVKVELLLIPDEGDSYQTKLNTMLAANDLPDVIAISEARAMEWGEKEDILLDLTPYEEQYANVLPGAKYRSVNGKFVGPLTGLETALIFANKQLFEEAGVPVPRTTLETAYTWDEFVETAKLMTKDRSGKNATEADFNPDEIQQYGIGFPKWWLGWYPLLRSNGGDITDADGLTYTMNTPECAEVFQNLQDLIYLHHVSPTPTASEGLPASAAQLATRRVAMVIDGQWNLPEMVTNRVPLALGVMPKYKEYFANLIGATFVVNAKTPNLDQALALHQALNNPESTFDLFVSGLWMPTDMRYLEDDALVASWTDNEAHPPEYRDVAIRPLLTNAELGPITIKDFAGLETRINAALDQVWGNTKPVQQVLDELGEEIGPLLTGRYPVS